MTDILIHVFRFITENFQPLILVCGGLFAWVKWVDSRNREIKEKRYSTYMNLINIISGKCPDGRVVMLTEEIAAVWLLLEYKEYDNITRKIYSHQAVRNSTAQEWNETVLPTIDELLQELKYRPRSFRLLIHLICKWFTGL
jgi:hypothetical protein